MLAMALSVLAPPLAQAAVTSMDRSGWIQVCSVSGMFWIQADSVGADDATSAPEDLPVTSTGMQCPWCQLHSPAAGPPSASASLAMAVAPAPLPGNAMAAPPPPGVWTGASARAPPRFA